MQANSGRAAEEKITVRVLVTGANSGLGFATCCRLIDEFLITRPQSQQLHLLFSTRDRKKSEATLKRLNAYFQSTLKAANAKTPGISLLLEPRVKLEGLLVDLTELLTVKALAQQLIKRGERLDAVFWNAGIAGWKGVNYLQATWDFMTGMIQATQYPQFMICDVGALTKPQLTGVEKSQSSPEPRLGQVFTANLFGHYMLTHWLTRYGILDGDSRIVWTTSISATPHTYNPDDFQGVRSLVAYESSKRLTDILVITAQLPSTKTYVDAFLPSSKSNPRPPEMYITHPGVVATSISGMNIIMTFMMVAVLYISRWIGSPWQLISPYKGSVSAVFAILAPPSQLSDLEEREGKGKWGSAADVFGNERVARTEIEGWGFGGEERSLSAPSGSLKTKRPGYRKPTKEVREEFEEQGRRAWKEMEELRVEWEKRLGPVEVDDVTAVDV